MNPYRIAEKVGRIVGWAFFACLMGLFLAAVVVQLVEDGWGWNVLWLIPGIPVGLVALVLVCGLIVGGTTWLEHKWRDAKHAWDRKEAS